MYVGSMLNKRPPNKRAQGACQSTARIPFPVPLTLRACFSLSITISNTGLPLFTNQNPQFSSDPQTRSMTTKASFVFSRKALIGTCGRFLWEPQHQSKMPLHCLMCFETISLFGGLISSHCLVFLFPSGFADLVWNSHIPNSKHTAFIRFRQSQIPSLKLWLFYCINNRSPFELLCLEQFHQL